MQTDPIGYGDGMNWYNYVGGDGVNWKDPSGLNALCRTVLSWVEGPENTTSDIVSNGGHYVEMEICQNILDGIFSFDYSIPDPNDIIVTAKKYAYCPVLSGLGENGRFRFGAEAGGGLGIFLKSGAGISLRGDGSLEADSFVTAGPGVGGGGGGKIGIDNAGSGSNTPRNVTVETDRKDELIAGATFGIGVDYSRDLGNGEQTAEAAQEFEPKSSASSGRVMAYIARTGTKQLTYRTTGTCP
jgi:hypothetical protein